MISRERFVNKIRDLNFTFKAQQRRVSLWRQRGTFVYISIPRRDELEDVWVTTNLRRAGLDDTEIRKFLGEAKS